METADTPRRIKRRKALAVIIPALLIGVAGASAATLGGITAPSLGADSASVTSCDTDGVTLAFTNSYDAASGTYKTTAVAVSSINATCNSKTLSLTLKDSSNVSLGSGSATVAAGAASVTISGGGASASSVAGAAVIIT